MNDTERLAIATVCMIVVIGMMVLCQVFLKGHPLVVWTIAWFTSGFAMYLDKAIKKGSK